VLLFGTASKGPGISAISGTHLRAEINIGTAECVDSVHTHELLPHPLNAGQSVVGARASQRKCSNIEKALA